MRRFSVQFLGVALLLSVSAPLAAQTFRTDNARPGSQTGFGLAVAIGGGDVFVGEAQNTYAPGFVYVYRNTAGNWAEIARLTASDTEFGDGFGRNIDVDGTTMVVTGSPDGSNGVAYIFERNGSGEWEATARLTANDSQRGDQFGAYARIDGDYVMVGAIRSDSTGAVYVFHRNSDGSWTEEAKLKGNDLSAGDMFGWTFDLDNGKALITAMAHDSARGAVYAFRLGSDGAWQQHAKVAPDNLEAGDRFAFHIVIDGNYALLGSLYQNNQTGTVIPMMFDDASGEWSTVQPIVAFDGQPQMNFGRNVALSGNNVLVGAPGFNGLYSFDFNLETGWNNSRKIRSEGVDYTTSGTGGDYFGAYIAADGDVAVIGMRGSGGAIIIEKNAEGVWEATATLASHTRDALEMITGETVTCADGSAALFDCGDVNLMSFLPVSELGGETGISVNDVWGWEYQGREYALVGRTDATAFVDITDPSNPVYLGELPRTEGSPPSTWRDIKVYDNHAFITADGAGQHGMQIFDLTQLVGLSRGPVTFEETAHYGDIGSAHNIVINEETGYAYAVGVNSGGETCGGGLHMINIQDPTNPTFAGCFSDPNTGRSSTGYSHDAQCIIYAGPDVEHVGKEICFGSNETAISIADVTDKDNPIALSNASYPNVEYAHQGWITDDHRYFFMNDELDELASPEEINRTRTIIWDISDLDDPVLFKEHFGTQESSDHNLYIRGNLMYQANYKSGLRILDISDVENPVEVGYFDTVPVGDNSASMGGAWSNYPYFTSGNVIVTSGQEGLFVLRRKAELVP